MKSHPNRHGLKSVAVFLCLCFLMLSSCSNPEIVPLQLSADVSRGQSDFPDIKLGVAWEPLRETGQLLGEQGQLLRYIEYRISIRNEGASPGRINLHYIREMGYDPYHGLYFLSEPGGDLLFTSGRLDELLDVLQEPMQLLVSSDEMKQLEHGMMEIIVQLRVQRISGDSVFSRWLELFGNSERRVRGELHIEYP